MKKLHKTLIALLTAGSLGLSAGFAAAQQAPSNADSPAELENEAEVTQEQEGVIDTKAETEKRMGVLTRTLNLTADQVRDITEIISQEVVELTELMTNQDLSEDERRSEIIEVRKSYGEKVLEELTEEQRSAYNQMMEAEIGVVRDTEMEENNIQE